MAAALQLGDFSRHLIVEVERWILAAPSVVFPINEGGRDARVLGPAQKRRPMIAAPGVVRRNVVQRDAWEIAYQRSGLLQHLPTSGQDIHRLVLGEQSNEPSELARHRLKMIRPAIAVPRPGEPDTGLRLPFRGPAITEPGRRIHWHFGSLSDAIRPNY